MHSVGRYSRDRKGDTPLNLAAAAGHSDVVVYFMRELTDAMDEFRPTHSNLTPVHSAVLGGQADVVRMLIRRFEIDKDIHDGNGWPPVHSAAWAAQMDMIELLIKEFGVDPGSTDKHGKTPLLLGVVARLDFGAVRAMHENLKCDVKTRDPFGSTLLHEAARSSTTDAAAIIRFLVLEHGHDVDARNKGSRTAVFCAAESGTIETVRLLGELGADLNAVDAQGQTPLHRAAELGRRDMIRALMDEFGLDGNAADASGRTPLQIAAKMGVNLA
jgi:ankyrin repeat protein